MHPLRVTIAALFLAAPASASANPPDEGRTPLACAALETPGIEHRALAACHDALRASIDGERPSGDGSASPDARGPLDQARLALDRADSLDSRGEPEAATRARRIARAALLLADRRRALSRAQPPEAPGGSAR